MLQKLMTSRSRKHGVDKTVIVREIGKRMSCGLQITETREVMVEVGVGDTVGGADSQEGTGGVWDMTMAVLNVDLRITGLGIVMERKKRATKSRD